MSADVEFMVKLINEQLIGNNIAGSVTAADNESFGFVLDNGDVVWVDCDAEGNGPGWLTVE